MPCGILKFLEESATKTDAACLTTHGYALHFGMSRLKNTKRNRTESRLVASRNEEHRIRRFEALDIDEVIAHCGIKSLHISISGSDEGSNVWLPRIFTTDGDLCFFHGLCRPDATRGADYSQLEGRYKLRYRSIILQVMSNAARPSTQISTHVSSWHFLNSKKDLAESAATG
jgi:hypothetical protein